MTDAADDVVRAASGSLVQIELYQSGLKDAGIEGRVVGQELDAGLGSALPLSVELWVHRGDAAAAARVIAEMEAERGDADMSEAVGTPEE
jgi:hypothetical protein